MQMRNLIKEKIAANGYAVGVFVAIQLGYKLRNIGHERL